MKMGSRANFNACVRMNNNSVLPIDGMRSKIHFSDSTRFSSRYSTRFGPNEKFHGHGMRRSKSSRFVPSRSSVKTTCFATVKTKFVGQALEFKAMAHKFE